MFVTAFFRTVAFTALFLTVLCSGARADLFEEIIDLRSDNHNHNEALGITWGQSSNTEWWCFVIMMDAVDNPFISGTELSDLAAKYTQQYNYYTNVEECNDDGTTAYNDAEELLDEAEAAYFMNMLTLAQSKYDDAHEKVFGTDGVEDNAEWANSFYSEYQVYFANELAAMYEEYQNN